MPYMKKLQTAFMAVIVFSSLLLFYNFYNNYKFKNNELPSIIMDEIIEKEREILNNIYLQYNLRVKVPIIISNKMGNSLYGLATLDKDGKIKIYLNKKMFQESKDYMINNVLAHEYAHAMMFIFGDISREKKGHSLKWINICKKIGGVKCEQYVNSNDIIIGKRNIF